MFATKAATWKATGCCIPGSSHNLIIVENEQKYGKTSRSQAAKKSVI